MLTQQQINFYHEHGYLRIPQVFTAEETQELSNEMDRLVEDWGVHEPRLDRPLASGVYGPGDGKEGQIDGDARPALLLGGLDAGRHQPQACRSSQPTAEQQR